MLSRATTLTLVLLTLACGSTPNRRVAGATSSERSVERLAPGGAGASASEAAGAASAPQSAGAETPRLASVPAAAGAPGDETELAGQQGTGPAGSASVAVDAPLAFVAGQPIPASELLRRWRNREPRKVRTYLQEFVTDRMVLLEARRLGIQLERSRIDAAVSQTVELMERQIGEKGPAMDLQTFIRDYLKLDPARYMQRMRSEQATDLLAERCVRAWMLESERAEVRFIAVKEQSLAEDVMRQLAEGADFREMASQYSVDSSAKDGGRMPAIVRAAESPLSRLAFATPVGQVGGPMEDSGTYMLLLVESRPDPLVGEWSEIGARVEASLAERGLEEPEYWQWNRAMSERYGVDIEPFNEFMDRAPVR